MVRTEFFNELNIAPGPSEENAITPEQVATAIIYTIEQGPNMLIEEINLAPLKKVVEHKKSKQ